MKKNIFGVFIPLITTVVVLILASFFNLKGLFIISIVALFPLSFLVEGIICAVKNIGWLIPLAISLITFIIILFVFLNDSATIYLAYYCVAYAIGYVVTKLILKLGYVKKTCDK